jgi:ubiquitin carboxyl-terminal hydrolase 14
MPIFKVNIKWSKELFKDIELNTDDSPLVFKAQMYALSNVKPERQKIMCGGKIIGDNDWQNLTIKNGMTCMMMGSADELPVAPVKPVQFMEDLTEAQLAQVTKY